MEILTAPARIILLLFFDRYGDYKSKPELLKDRPYWRCWWHIRNSIYCMKNIRYAIRCWRMAPKGKKWMALKWALRA